jgi:FkbM family methyltransferase
MHEAGKIPVLILNLESDTEHWTRLVAQFQTLPDFTPRRIPGVPGSTLPQMACNILTKTAAYGIGRGTLGVFLAHIAAWEAAAALDGPYCVVLEDDVELIRLDRLAGFTLPPGIDLAFCGDRMGPRVEQTAPLQCLDMAVGLLALHASGVLAPGADGYLLTPPGARALLEAVRQDLCFGHVDWRMLRYAVTAELVDTVIPATKVAEVLRDHHHVERPAWGVVRAGVLSPSLVRHRSAPSRRERHDEVTHAEAAGTTLRHVEFEGRVTSFHIVDPADHIQGFACRGEFYQARQLAFHRDLIPMDSTVIDVGANIGNHTLFYARYTWAARVYPLEPNPPARAMLLQSVTSNLDRGYRAEIRLDHVSQAVASTVSRAKMVAGPAKNLGAAVLEPTAATDAEALDCLPLDELTFEGPVAFLKIDAGPMGLEILAGAARLIATCRPSIAIEIWQRDEPAFWQWLDDNLYLVVHVFADYLGCRDFVIVPRSRIQREAQTGSAEYDTQKIARSADLHPGHDRPIDLPVRLPDAPRTALNRMQADPEILAMDDDAFAAALPDELRGQFGLGYQACIETGFAKLAAGANEAAFLAFDAARRREATADALAWAGVALRRHGNSLVACRYHRMALERDADHVTAGLELASCLEDLHEFDAAIEAYRRLIKRRESETNTYLYNRLGVCYERSGRLDLLSKLLDEPNYYRHIEEDYARESTLLWLLKLGKPGNDAANVAALRNGDVSAPNAALSDALTIYTLSRITPDHPYRQAYQTVLEATPYGADAARVLREYPLGRVQDQLSRIEFMPVDSGIRKVCDHIRGARPFSLIRLGDGEGNLLAHFMQPDSEFLKQQAEKILRNWFGNHALPIGNYAELDSDLRDAIRDADLLGVPSLARLKYEMTNDPRGYWGVYFAALYSCTHAQHRQFVVPVIHQDLFRDQSFVAALRSVSALHTISCHAGLGTKLRHHLNVARGTDVTVPGEMGIDTLPSSSRTGVHYPDEYRRVIPWINQLDSGAVVLIAAGVCGKVYAQRAKRAGCAAIDIGAMADYIMGYQTRGIFHNARFRADQAQVEPWIGT